MKTLGSRIRARRKELKLTQEDVAKKVGVSAVAIGHWEKDVNEPSGSNLHALAKTLKISIDELLQDNLRIAERASTYQVSQLSPEAIQVARAFQQSSPELQAAALRLLQVLQQSGSNTTDE